MKFSEKLLTILEKQQEILFIQEQKRQKILKCILYSIATYMIFLAIYFIGHFHFWHWVANPSIFFAMFLIATAIIIYICINQFIH